MDNCPQFVSNILATLCAVAGMRLTVATEYHPQSNGQEERLNKMLAACSRHYIDKHQKNWDTHVRPLTYGYNRQVHRTTNTSPFSLMLSKETPEASMSKNTRKPKEPSTLPPAQAIQKSLENLRLLKQRVKRASNQA